MLEMPIVNYFVIAGGFGYQFYKVAHKRAASHTYKAKSLGINGGRVAVGFAGGFLGMTVGQILIPVPGVGAFIGGVVGGAVFETGGRHMTGFFQRKSFQKDIRYLQ